MGRVRTDTRTPPLYQRRAKVNREAGYETTANTAVTSTKFTAWDEETSAALENKEELKIFPAPPIKCCSMACNKKKGHLDFCEHSLEKFMQGFGATGLEKMERLKFEERRFHPGRFMKCPEEVRDEIVQKASEMFQMFQALKIEDKSD